MSARSGDIDMPEVVLIEPRVFADERGWFFESYNRSRFNGVVGFDVDFVQDNHSSSARDVLRGLHYQVPPHAQGKLVRAVAGAVWDVAVDIRRSSPTFGQWVAYELSAANRRQLWVPPGFAHGFIAIADGAELLYKTTDYYAPECDRSIRWNDRHLAIRWPIDGEPILSEKDGSAPELADAEIFD